jgi:hypothetical protein
MLREIRAAIVDKKVGGLLGLRRVGRSQVPGMAGLIIGLPRVKPGGGETRRCVSRRRVKPGHSVIVAMITSLDGPVVVNRNVSNRWQNVCGWLAIRHVVHEQVSSRPAQRGPKIGTNPHVAENNMFPTCS